MLTMKLTKRETMEYTLSDDARIETRKEAIYQSILTGSNVVVLSDEGKRLGGTLTTWDMYGRKQYSYLDALVTPALLDEGWSLNYGFDIPPI